MRDDAIVSPAARSTTRARSGATSKPILAWQAHGGVPVNLTMLIEGEEEIGSRTPRSVRHENIATQLKADVAVISDTNQFARGMPAITYGLRGLVYMEVFLTGPNHDLHSGLYGGAVPNPANVLCELLATLHDDDGRVNIPGFYDDVVAAHRSRARTVAELPFDEKRVRKSLGLSERQRRRRLHLARAQLGPPDLRRQRPDHRLPGPRRQDRHPIERVGEGLDAPRAQSRPGEDPSRFRASDLRALPEEREDRIHLARPSEPVLVPIDSRPTQLAAEALEIGFGTDPTLMREGGSIPVVGLIKRVLGIDTLLIGFGLPDDRVHSPNEKFDLDALHGGTRTAAALYQKMAEIK